MDVTTEKLACLLLWQGLIEPFCIARVLNVLYTFVIKLINYLVAINLGLLYWYTRRVGTFMISAML